MRVILFGATGMVGQGVLGECLRDDRVSNVTIVVRSPTGRLHAKLREVVHDDFMDFSSLSVDADACFWCLGVSSNGLNEAQYTVITHDYAVAAAKAIVRQAMTLIFVSGAGADLNAMWARVKKRTEDALFAMPFKAVHVFRPGFIQPLDGIKSRTTLYNVLYPVLYPFMLAFKAFAPGSVTDTRRIGLAMINIAAGVSAAKVLGNAEINAAAEPRRGV